MVDHPLSDGSGNLEQTRTLNLLQPYSFRNPNAKPQEGSMVVIRDFQDHNESFIFPPVNHENLHISTESHQFEKIPESPSSSSTSCSSPSSSVSSFSFPETDIWGLPSPPPSYSLVRKNFQFTGWTCVSKVIAMVTSFRNYSANKAAIWSIGPAASVILMSWWMCIQVWGWLRRRRRQTREKHLMAVIKQKDERIAQLLHQIAQMNEILTPRHKTLASKLANCD